MFFFLFLLSYTTSVGIYGWVCASCNRYIMIISILHIFWNPTRENSSSNNNNKFEITAVIFTRCSVSFRWVHYVKWWWFITATRFVFFFSFLFAKKKRFRIQIENIRLQFYYEYRWQNNNLRISCFFLHISQVVNWCAIQNALKMAWKTQILLQFIDFAVLIYSLQFITAHRHRHHL